MNSILNKLNIKENNYGSCIGGSNWLNTSDSGEIISMNPTTNEVIRVKEGGKILESIPVKSNAYACMLGGENRKTLFICTSSGTDEESCKEDKGGCIETIEVDVAGFGYP